MNLEDRLRETLRRAAAHAHPDAAHAYDRFRRHRRGRLLAVPALATAASVIVLVAVLAAGQLTPGPARPGHPTPTPTPGTVPTPTPEPQPPLDYQPGPRTVEVPEAGYAVQVPDGWLVARLGSELRLRPEGEPRAQIEIRTVALPPELGPGKGEAYPATTHFPTTGFHTPSGPYEYSRRPDGRRVLKAGRAATSASYYVAWPYHCPPDLPCRTFTKLRTLSVRFYAPEVVWPEVRQVGEEVVRDARPTTNALPGGGQAPAGREPCPVAVTSSDGSSSASHVTLRFLFENSALIACRFRAEVELMLGSVSTGKRLPVHEPNQPVVLSGSWPEGGAEPDGHFAVTWRWTNWCGTDEVFAQVVVNGRAGRSGVNERVDGSGRFAPLKPACVDRARPSVLEVVGTEQ